MLRARLEAEQVFADRFRVIRWIDDGGMGSVYEVELLSTKRRRALKILKADLSQTSEERARFIREAQTASQVEHENVVDVSDVGVDEATGIPWLLMELLRGEKLSSMIERRKRLDPGEVMGLFRQLGRGLGAAHTRGVVHLDLKPENLILTRGSEPGEPPKLKVVDFGLAKIVERHHTHAKVTREIGSVLWMAPEQFARGGEARPSTDVWAMGLLAFYLLTGEFYWRSAHDDPFKMSAVMLEIVTEPIDAPSRRAVEYGAGEFIPLGFDRWFSQCVHKDARERFEDAARAAATLCELLASLGASAKLPVPEVDTAGERPSAAASIPDETARPLALTQPLRRPPVAPTVPVGVQPATEPLRFDLVPSDHTVTVPSTARKPRRSYRWAWGAGLLAGAAAAGIVSRRGAHSSAKPPPGRTSTARFESPPARTAPPYEAADARTTAAPEPEPERTTRNNATPDDAVVGPTQPAADRTRDAGAEAPPGNERATPGTIRGETGSLALSTLPASNCTVAGTTHSTPFIFRNVPAGTQQVWCRRDNPAVSKRFTVTIVAGQTTRETNHPLDHSTGTLALSTSPASTCTVAGQTHVVPFIFRNVPAGPQHVWCRNEELNRYTDFDVLITQGQTTREINHQIE